MCFYTRELLSPWNVGSVKSPILLRLNLTESNPTVSLSGDNIYCFVVSICPQHPYPCKDSPALTIRESRIMCLSLSVFFSTLPPLFFSLCVCGRSPEGGNPYSSLFSLSFIWGALWPALEPIHRSAKQEPAHKQKSRGEQLDSWDCCLLSP